MSTGTIICNRRKELGLTLEDVAQRVGVGKSTVRKWEQGMIKNMRRDRISALASVLQLDPIVLVTGNDCSHKEQKVAPILRRVEPLPKVETSDAWAQPLIGSYQRATAPTQQNVCKLLDIPHVKPSSAKLVKQKMLGMVVYDDPAAAGLPLYAEADFERIPFPADEVPDGADFGIRISGDSMEPTIENGSIVWVHKQLDIRDREVGIFILEDGAVCKRARVRPNGLLLRLESDNPKHMPITGTDLIGVRCVGKVLL